MLMLFYNNLKYIYHTLARVYIHFITEKISKSLPMIK